MDDEFSRYERGQSALKAGHWVRAATALRPLQSSQPDNAMLLEAMGRSYLALGWRWMAARNFERIVDMYPLDHYAHHCLGRAYEGMGQPSLALHHYKVASLLSPANAHYQMRLGMLAWGFTATNG